MKLKARKRFWLALIVTALIYIFFPGYLRWEKANESLRDYREKNERLREENLRLKKEIWKLKHDSFYIENMSRKEMGYARDGEIIYEIEREE